MKFCFSRYSFLLACLLLAPMAQAQENLADALLDPRNGTRLEVRSLFDPMPPSGYVPLRIVATNGTARDAVWRLDFSSSTTDYRRNNVHASTLSLPIPAGSTQTAVFLAPLAVDYGDSGYGSNSHSFTGALTGPYPYTFSGHNNRTAGFPAIAISKTLADSSLPRLNDDLERRQKAASSYGRSDHIFGSRFTPADLPEDWLAFSGFDYVLLTDTEWQSLKSGTRNALLQWVRLGGKLHFYAISLPAPGLPKEDETHSLGQIKSFTWNGSLLPAYDTVGRYWNEPERCEHLRNDHARGNEAWALLEALVARQFNSWQVLLFLVIFGVLVGPVNLYVLAPSGRRHRLFFTTPLLSLGASAVMVGLILIQDGMGGVGARVVFINVEPSETTAYVTQKQISRTGVLLGAGFELKQPALVEPLALPASEWVKLQNTSNSQPVNLNQEGAARGGNFFQSRAEQAQMIRAAVSTRARLEVQPGATPDAAPTIVSALGFTLEEMFYAGPDGTIWSLKSPLATGQKAELAKVQPNQLLDWWKKHYPLIKIWELHKLTSVLPNHFFATAKAAPGFTQETLSSIRWQEDQVLVYGSVTPP